MKEALERGEYYTTLKDGDFFVDVYKHAKASYLYVVDIYGDKEQLTTAVLKRKYRKELNRLFFIPLAQEMWNEHGIFEAIKKDRVTA